MRSMIPDYQSKSPDQSSLEPTPKMSCESNQAGTGVNSKDLPNWGYWLAVAILAAMPICSVLVAARHDDLQNYRYVVPLTGGYYLQRLDQGFSASVQEGLFGPFQIVHPYNGQQLDWEPILPFGHMGVWKGFSGFRILRGQEFRKM